jgi:hypothetical protein
MIPVLLDLLTVFFIIAGMVLLWLNLRVWRRTRLQIAPENSEWSTPFDDAIDLPDGSKLITLRDAAAYVGTLPEAEQQAAEWKSAARSLIEAATHRDLLVLAHIDMLKALNRHV